MTDDDLFTRDQVNVDPFYSRFLRPRGYGWAVGSVFNSPTGESPIISAERRFERGPVEPRYVRLLDKLRPHYARAAMLAARMGLERATAMTKVLESFRLPAAVLVRNGSLLTANGSFRSLVPKVFRDRRTGVEIADEKANALLSGALAIKDAGGWPVQSIPVPAAENHPPLIIHFIPVCGDARDIFSRGVSILVVTPVVPKEVPTATVLQGLFDLTPGEARVAKGVAEAQSIESMARSLSLSRETVRGRLKSILSKTGLHRQSELANLLSGLPRDSERP